MTFLPMWEEKKKRKVKSHVRAGLTRDLRADMVNERTEREMMALPNTPIACVGYIINILPLR